MAIRDYSSVLVRLWTVRLWMVKLWIVVVKLIMSRLPCICTVFYLEPRWLEVFRSVR